MHEFQSVRINSKQIVIQGSTWDEDSSTAR